jgi:hypothetical protein
MESNLDEQYESQWNEQPVFAGPESLGCFNVHFHKRSTNKKIVRYSYIDVAMHAYIKYADSLGQYITRLYVPQYTKATVILIRNEQLV